MAAENEIFTDKEAADFLKISTAALRDLYFKKEIPGREIEKELRFSKQSLLLWLSNTDLNSQKVVAVPVQHNTELDKHEKSQMAIDDFSETDIEVIALRDRAALNQPGKISVELDLGYSKQQTYSLTPELDRLVNLEQKNISSALTLRYGVSNGYQFRLFTPVQYSSLEAVSNEYRLYQESHSDFGPVMFGFQKVLIKEDTGYPGIIAGLTAGIGSGAEVTASCTLSKTYDPAILYGSFQYTHPIHEESSTSWNLFSELGVGLKMNEILMLQTAIVARYKGEKTTVYGTVSGREDFGLSFGLNWRIFKNIYLEPSVMTMLTNDGSDISIGMSLVYEL